MVFKCGCPDVSYKLNAAGDSGEAGGSFATSSGVRGVKVGAGVREGVRAGEVSGAPVDEKWKEGVRPGRVEYLDRQLRVGIFGCQLGHYSLGRKEIEKLMPALEKSWLAHYCLSICMGHMEENEGALQHATEAVRLSEDNLLAVNGLATCLVRVGSYGAAESCGRKALELGGDDFTAVSNYGTILMKLERWEEAEGYLLRAVELGNSPEEKVFVLMGLLESLEKQGKELEWSAERADVLFYYANYLQSMKRMKEALRFFKMAVDFCPNEGKWWNNYGMVLCDVGKFDEALPKLEKAVELSKGDGHYLPNLWRAYEVLGRAEQAEECIDKALSSNPDCYSLCVEAGKFYCSEYRVDFSKAMELFERAAKLKPEEGEAYGCMGFVLKNMGLHQAAVGCFRKALEFDAENEKWQGYLAVCESALRE